MPERYKQPEIFSFKGKLEEEETNNHSKKKGNKED